MRKIALSSMPEEQLIERFVEICVLQDKELYYGTPAAYNRLMHRMREVYDDLIRRDEANRRRLLALYDHPNAQVRMKAAILTLKIEPVEARRVLRAIADSKIPPRALHAGMSLSLLDAGIGKVPD